MRTSLAGARNKRSGVTLLELLIVTTLIALLAGIAYPSAANGIDSLRLRSTMDQIANLLSTSIDHAQRRQQVVEVWISPQENVLIARSPDLGFARRLEISAPFRITSVYPRLEGPAQLELNEPRHFLLYPGGTVPRIGIEISNAAGRKRIVRVDPLSGMPRVEAVPQ